MSEIKDYTDDIQELFLRFLASDNDLFARCQNILDADHFSKKYRPLVSLMQSHAHDHNVMPTFDQLNAICAVKLEPLQQVAPEHQNWFMAEFETFARHKALEKAIIESADLLENKNYGEVENKIKAAVQTALVKDLGLEYYENPKERLEWIRQQAGAVSTGWKDIDQKLYGGLNRGEITIFAGGSGSGKSLWLQNFGVNWSQAGLNCVYISLELSEQLISMRLDSMVSGYTTRDIMKNMDDVDLKVRMKGKNAGKLRVKYMSSGITVNDIRAFLREYEIQANIKVDALLVDYLDLMMPINKRISASDQFIKDKFVSEELRNLAAERNILLVSASQLNRSSVDEVEFDHSHIAGGISKINTADNVVGIFTSKAMRERGRYQIQFMKTRSSSGVGSKVDLKFDVDTLRISDLLDGEAGADEVQTVSLVDQLKRSNVIKPQEPDAQETVSKSLQLREFLKSRK